MRFDGTLTKWKDDRGFGFVTPDVGDGELFAHISAFPKQGGRPTVGERISFEVTAGADGKKKAISIAYLARSSKRDRPPRGNREPARSSFSGVLGVLLVVLAAGGAVYMYKATSVTPEPERIVAPAAERPSVRYLCDGRTHCSQMTSCEEASYFLRNCPGVKMDGDNDGVPCEEQWCSTSF